MVCVCDFAWALPFALGGGTGRDSGCVCEEEHRALLINN